MTTQQFATELSNLIVPYGIRVLGAIAILIVGRLLAGLVSRFIKHALKKSKTDETLSLFFGRLGYMVVIVVAVVASLERFGIKTTSFVAILGAAGFAIGLAMQGSLSNFASGVMIIAFRPFAVGDFIEAGGVSGTVKEIRLFTTIMATPDNIRIIVPNTSIFSGVIQNFSVNATRRIDITVGIGYGENIGTAVSALQGVMKADDRVMDDPEPAVVVTELADSSVNLLARCWTSRLDFWATKCDMTRAFKERLDSEGVEIPFPQRVVHLQQEAS